MKSALRLSSVYSTPQAVEILYRLMAERERKVNISHHELPTMAGHRKFVRSRPYKGWFVLFDGKDAVGATYLSKNDEIGLFIFKKYRGRGYGAQAAELLMKKFPRVKRFLANINPANGRSIQFFKRRGFRHIQNTYEYRRHA